ncbi:MAG: sigma factor-like helix-turn-helix DNA-binding protein [Armatimonadota bacterium]|nr:sigma factor-like helix-turn-helix DNA-binding protein [Armatimonadota bacterium]MDR7439889.1 sigma factor-like helix-turn-helix DNA-binding protein [Armatimonadota bacterium]MDR7563316.1 sigma factor-like helix-turn-helix DNA-binding protein [Armatimonadota bacterium]MDR7568113.1 sigma factor-like helix-turn-helix DNA-binding protein [Armatimonadota bacterium]MDR7601981.1 sigma factor-like helix-turn-helix DNA-binding protein [Armatimonadota bacterium]
MERMLADRFEVIRLFDLYARLLTPRQQQLVRMYFHEDLSLAEIAEYLGVTRQAIHDSLRRSIAELYRYEDLLGLAGQARSVERRKMEVLRQLDWLEEEVRALEGNTRVEQMLACIQRVRDLL